MNQVSTALAHRTDIGCQHKISTVLNPSTILNQSVHYYDEYWIMFIFNFCWLFMKLPNQKNEMIGFSHVFECFTCHFEAIDMRNPHGIQATHIIQLIHNGFAIDQWCLIHICSIFETLVAIESKMLQKSTKNYEFLSASPVFFHIKK